MARTASGRLRLSKSLLPRTSRFQASKRAPRKPSSSRLSAWIMVPMAPSSTRMRSAASRRSVVSVGERSTDIAALGLAFIVRTPPPPPPLPSGERERAAILLRLDCPFLFIGTQAEQVADCVDEIGAVHGVEVKVGDAVIDQVEHLFGGDRG